MLTWTTWGPNPNFFKDTVDMMTLLSVNVYHNLLIKDVGYLTESID